MPPEDLDVGIEHDDRQLLADTALVVEALASFAGHPDDLETPRQRRAWTLIRDLADDLDMTPTEVLRLDTDSQSHHSE